MSTKTITLAITGASGGAYGIRLLQMLLQSDAKVYLLLSDASKVMLATECGFKPFKSDASFLQQLGDIATDNLTLYASDDWFAPPASGSAKIDGMIVCPCSMGTLSSIATSSSNTLLERAADVSIKERRKLVLVPRETPVSATHLEHMLKLTHLGVIILPASPGFYFRPKSVEDLVDFMVARVLDAFDISHQLSQRWGQ